MGAVKVVAPPGARVLLVLALVFSLGHPGKADDACIHPQLVCDSVTASSRDPGAIYQNVSYSAPAPNCGGATVTVQTLTNPFSTPCLVFADFTVDDDIVING